MNSKILFAACLLIIVVSLMNAGCAGSIVKDDSGQATNMERGYYDRIDAYVQSQPAQMPNTALAYGIVHEGQIVHLKAFDPAHSSEQEITPQTPFVVASVGKTFTGLAIRQLVNSGKVNLDTPVQQYVPWFTLADQESSARITVRHAKTNRAKPHRSQEISESIVCNADMRVAENRQFCKLRDEVKA